MNPEVIVSGLSTSDTLQAYVINRLLAYTNPSTSIKHNLIWEL